MSKYQGWNIDRSKSIPLDFTADVSEGDLVLLSGAVCGAGGLAIGAVDRDIDISEDGARGEAHTAGIMIGFAAAAVTLGDRLKGGAAGTVTPADTDQDYYVGIALTAQATVGGVVKYLWAPGYYATT